MSTAPTTNPGDIFHWPILKVVYRTDAERIADLLPPGIEPGAQPLVHVHIYNFPVPDEPEYGVVVTVDADYRGTPGLYTLGYGIDQESAIFISRDTNGQPKYPCETTYYRVGERVVARCSHQGYTFLEIEGRTTGVEAELPKYEENEWWIKSSRAVGGAQHEFLLDDCRERVAVREKGRFHFLHGRAHIHYPLGMGEREMLPHREERQVEDAQAILLRIGKGPAEVLLARGRGIREQEEIGRTRDR